MKPSLHGKSKLQLIRNGKVKKEIVDNNIATNFLNDVLNMGRNIFSYGGYWTFYDLPQRVLENLIPITGGSIGGVMLFDNTITENANNCSLKDYHTHLIGHAGSGYSGDSIYRGTFSDANSGTIPNGYRYVWTFPTNCANGTIKSLCLTSRLGGNGLTGGALDSLTDAPDANTGFGAFNFSPTSFYTSNTSNISASSTTSSLYPTGSFKTFAFGINGVLGWSERTAKPLCWRKNADNTISIWLAAYSSTENDLVICRCDSPSFKELNPFANPDDFRFFNFDIRWRATTTTNIHACMFYFDGENIRCTRCVDDTVKTKVTFEDIAVDLEGTEVLRRELQFTTDDNFYRSTINAYTDISENMGYKFGFVTPEDNLIATPYNETSYRGTVMIVNPSSDVILWRNEFYTSTTTNRGSGKAISALKQYINGAALLPGVRQVSPGSVNTTYQNSAFGYIVSDKIKGSGVLGCGSSWSNNVVNAINDINICNIIPPVDNSAGFITSINSGGYLIMNISFNSNYLATINNLATPITKTDEDVLKVTYDITYSAE